MFDGLEQDARLDQFDGVVDVGRPEPASEDLAVVGEDLLGHSVAARMASAK